MTTVIFDLGDVVIKTKPDVHYKMLAHYCSHSAKHIKNIIENSTLVHDFEIGKITPEVFTYKVNSLIGSNLSVLQLQNIWNTVIDDIDMSMVKIIRKLDSSVTIIYMSNTNPFHFTKVKNMLLNHTIFYPCFLSFEYKKVKPYKEFYYTLHEECNLDNSKVIFVDDAIANVTSAKECGFTSIHHKSSEKTFHAIQQHIRL